MPVAAAHDAAAVTATLAATAKATAATAATAALSASDAAASAAAASTHARTCGHATKGSADSQRRHGRVPRVRAEPYMLSQAWL